MPKWPKQSWWNILIISYIFSIFVHFIGPLESVIPLKNLILLNIYWSTIGEETENWFIKWLVQAVLRLQTCRPRQQVDGMVPACTSLEAMVQGREQSFIAESDHNWNVLGTFNANPILGMDVDDVHVYAERRGSYIYSRRLLVGGARLV
jgi:hypothetical protein